MANPEHIAILKKGVNVWNQWRLEYPLKTPDLAGANLYKSFLRGINLSEARLMGANLEGAYLQNANLCLIWASGAIFSHSQLEDTNFSTANLQNAYINSANLFK